jgi:hypothetical protein
MWNLPQDHRAKRIDAMYHFAQNRVASGEMRFCRGSKVC